MSHVVALVADRMLQERLRSAFVRRYDVHFARAAAEFWAALRERPTVLVVVDVGPHGAADVSDTIRLVRVRHPHVPVVAYCRVRHELAADVLTLAHAGVHDLVFVGVDDDQLRLARLVSNAAYRSVADDVIGRAAASGAAVEALPYLRAFFAAAERPLSVRAIAGDLQVHRRTLVKRLAAVGLPTPQTLGAWCRLLVAARLLDDPTHTVERVAHDLGFASANALRNLFQRHAKLSPTTLRARGGYPYFRDRFAAYLAGTAVTRRRTRDGHRSATVGPT